VLQYLRSGPFPCPWDEFTCEGAAMNGHLRVLTWALEQDCPYTSTMWSEAARNGHVHVLRWLHASGWDLSTVDDSGVNYHDKRTMAWMVRMRSPWQKLRNAVRLRCIVSYWWSLGRVGF